MATTNKTKKERFAVIHVKVNEDWLTADGENSEEEGWKEIEDKLGWLLTTDKMVAIELEMSFLEWNEKEKD